MIGVVRRCLARLRTRLSLRGRSRLRRWVRRGAITGGIVGILAVISFAVLWELCPFDVEQLERFPAATVVTDRDGAWLRVYRSSRDEFRVPVRIDEVSHWLVQATIAVEDRNFRSHAGVDVAAVLRASWQNVSRWEVHSGASTLTMQLVRILVERPRTLRSKAIEAFYALQLDAKLDKDLIAEHYLNLAPYGGNVRGVEAAARRYFGKGARHLDLAEAALLAGLPQSPSWLRPDRHYERAIARRQEVLDAMLSEEMIDFETHAAASRSRPTVRRHAWPLRAPHLADIARATGSGSGERACRVVESTLDSAWQSSVKARVGRALKELVGEREPPSAAVVVMDVATSQVRALLGSPEFRDFEHHGQVNGALARRSPGSALKPFLFAHAFDRGLASPSSFLADVMAPFDAYVPENYDRTFHGPVSSAEALSRSYNIPAVRLQQRVGTSSFISLLRRLGLDTVDRSASHYGLTLCLGGGEVRLLDLTNAYATLVRGGVYRIPRFSTRDRSPYEETVFGAGSARLVLDILSDPDHLRVALGRRPSETGTPLGYKTGTSFGLRDAWAVAFSPAVVVGVWVGDPLGRPRPDLVGLEAAAPLALGIARELTAPQTRGWIEPRDVYDAEVCALTGYPPSRACTERRAVRTCAATRRLPECSVHRNVLVDRKRRFELCSSCAGSGDATREVVEAWPAGIERWLTARGRARHRLPHDPGCVNATRRGQAPRILSPVNGARFRVLPSAPFEQTIALSAAAGADVGRLYWFVDDELFAATEPLDDVEWRLCPGSHRVRCVDDRGRGDSAVFLVER